MVITRTCEPPPRVGCGPVERAGAPSYTVRFAQRLEGPPRFSQAQYRPDAAWTSRWVVLPVTKWSFPVLPSSLCSTVPNIVALLFTFVMKSIILCFFVLCICSLYHLVWGDRGLFVCFPSFFISHVVISLPKLLPGLSFAYNGWESQIFLETNQERIHNLVRTGTPSRVQEVRRPQREQVTKLEKKGLGTWLGLPDNHKNTFILKIHTFPCILQTRYLEQRISNFRQSCQSFRNTFFSQETNPRENRKPVYSLAFVLLTLEWNQMDTAASCIRRSAGDTSSILKIQIQ